MITLPKILFTLAVIIIVWQGYKWLGRMQTRRNAIAREGARGSGRGGRAVGEKVRLSTLTLAD